jgi:hypothetical protein
MKMSGIRRISDIVESVTLSNVRTGVTDDKKYEPEREITATDLQSG